jgi:hypothetical protein
LQNLELFFAIILFVEAEPCKIDYGREIGVRLVFVQSIPPLENLDGDDHSTDSGHDIGKRVDVDLFHWFLLC